MSITGEIILLVIIFCLLFRVLNLKNENTKLKEKLLERNIFVIESLKTLENVGEYYIDGDADPLPVDGYTVVYHKKNGRLKWENFHKFYIPEKSIRGHELHEILLEFDVLNRNYLDFLIKHCQLIPNNWPTFIPFWGTVYCQISSGHCFIKCLVRRDSIYVVEKRWLNSYFDANMPAILK